MPSLFPCAQDHMQGRNALATNTLDENLPDDRLGYQCELAQTTVGDGHVAPAQDFHAVVDQRLLQDSLAPAAKLRIPGSENHPDAVAERLGQVKAQLLTLDGEELVRNLEQNARPIAGRFVGAGCPPVCQVDEDLHAVFEDRVVPRARDIHHGADPTRIVFILRFVQTLVMQSRHWVPRNCPSA